MTPLMNLFFLLLVTTTLISCQTTPLDCGFLADSETFPSASGTFQYDGQCCNEAAVEYLDENDPGWRKNTSSKQGYLYDLYKGGYCNVSTTTTVSTTTEYENCFWLAYGRWSDKGCCNYEAVVYLNNTQSSWIDAQNRTSIVNDLEAKGYCLESTTSTMTSTTEETTTVPTTSTEEGKLYEKI
uniref:C-type lectin domain-containing protein n=1 Tax=Caenorhabditis tropicalis TaxID=1561998 RepID=A0A1I7T7T6_9PELO